MNLALGEVGKGYPVGCLTETKLTCTVWYA